MENKRRKKNKSNNGKNKKSCSIQDKNTEKRLTKVIFNDDDFINNLEKNLTNNNVSDTEKNLNSDENLKRVAVWHDDDDEKITVGSALKIQKRKLPSGGINNKSNKYSDLLKHKFVSTVGSPTWASLDKTKEEVDSDEEILKTCGHISDSKNSTYISKGIIEIKRLTDLNKETCLEGPSIKSVEFHSSASAALVAGVSGVASIFVVDGHSNNKLHSVSFTRFPIHCAKFINNNREILFGSQLPFMFNYDIETLQSTRILLPHGMTHMKNFILSPDQKIIAAAGRFGEVHILEAASRERLVTFKQEAEVSALTFSVNGKHLFGHGMEGRVTVWDMNTRRVCHHWYDEGCIQGSSITYSPSGQFLATGSYQGVVNIYETNQLFSSEAPIPRKRVLNLTTEISSLQFNCTSELLAFSSNSKENALKLLHVPSGTVYSNFPNSKESLGNVAVVKFSPNSGYLAVSNNKSKVCLYRLKHYGDY